MFNVYIIVFQFSDLRRVKGNATPVYTFDQSNSEQLPTTSVTQQYFAEIDRTGDDGTGGEHGHVNVCLYEIQ